MLRAYRRIVLPAAALLIAGACQGTSPAGPSPPPASCTFTLSPSTLAFGASGGTSSITVTTGSSCAWTAASDRGWLTIGSGASGRGSGTVTVAVTANTNSDARAGTLTVAGQPVAVSQDGTERCIVAMSPASASFSKDGGSGTIDLTAPASCAWTAASSAGWVTNVAPAGGHGNATVTYGVTRNSAVDSRTATIRAGDAVHTVSQAGDGGACTYQVAPVEISACMSVGHELTTTVSTQAACGWTVAADASWITPIGGASRTGSGDVRVTIDDNYDAPRIGVLKLRWDTPTAGQNVRVSQAGCRYAVSTTGMNVPADGGTFTFDVYQQSDPLECGGPLQNGCVWTASADAAWITVTTPMPRAGDDRVSFTVASNADGPRSARITVRDKAVTIVQAAR